MNKINTNKSADDQSASVNNAAKDDVLVTNSANSYSIATNPGSAKIQSMVGAILSADGQTFTVDAGVDHFTYVSRMGNGTFSEATVKLNGAGASLFSDSFEHYTTSELFETNLNLASGSWTGIGANGDVVKSGYQNIVGTDGAYWLDTQGSPGGVNISQDVVDVNAGHAQISLSVAEQQFPGYQTTGDLQVLWNGNPVGTIRAADFAAANEFKTFNFVVDSNVNNTLQIIDTGTGYVGYAVDLVGVNDFFVA